MRKSLTLIFILIMLVSYVSGTTITNEEVDVDLETNQVKVKMHVGDLTSTNLTYLSTHSINNLEASSEDAEINCGVDSSPLESQISCRTNQRTDFTVYFNYTTNDLVTNNDGNRVFGYTKDFIRPTDNFSLSVTLPQGEVLIDQGDVNRPVYSPSTGQVSTGGRRITVSWDEKPQLGDTTSYRILFRPLEDNNQDNFLLIVLGIILASIGTLTVGFLGYRRFNRVNISEVYDDLGKDEKEVIDLLKENEGSLLQKELVERMDYSKAKISDIVSELVEKEILTKEKEGRSNRLSITKEYTY